MTDEQINAAIAEACGWVPDCDRGICWDQHGAAIITPPNYCKDLNAMHEAEKALSPNQWNDYALALNEVCWHWALIHAPARQRAEAFLRTLGKWEEGQK
jgi:hypothetical protein